MAENLQPQQDSSGKALSQRQVWPKIVEFLQGLSLKKETLQMAFRWK